MPKPMQEPTFLILTALAAGPLHGYAIIADVEEISAGGVRLRTGTLYAALERLLAEQLIEPEREEIVDGRLRRYYRLSDAGLARLETETARLRRNADVATARLSRRTRPDFSAPPGLSAPPGPADRPVRSRPYGRLPGEIRPAGGIA